MEMMSWTALRLGKTFRSGSTFNSIFPRAAQTLSSSFIDFCAVRLIPNNGFVGTKAVWYDGCCSRKTAGAHTAGILHSSSYMYVNPLPRILTV